MNSFFKTRQYTKGNILNNFNSNNIYTYAQILYIYMNIVLYWRTRPKGKESEKLVLSREIFFFLGHKDTYGLQLGPMFN